MIDYDFRLASEDHRREASFLNIDGSRLTFKPLEAYTWLPSHKPYVAACVRLRKIRDTLQAKGPANK